MSNASVVSPRLAASYQVLPGRVAGAFPAVSGLLIRALAAGFPPAIAMEVGTPDGSAYCAVGGWARLASLDTDGDNAVTSAAVPASAATLFDLASLTKVVATLPLVLLLHQRRQWSIDDPIARWLPGAPRSPVTISDCLLHIAGLVPFRQYYTTCPDAAAIRAAVLAELATAVRAPVSYSDVGFMLLGWAVEECSGEPLAEAFRREIATPLGMTSTTYRPKAPRTRFAATEADGDQRLRAGLVWGEAHDGNAHALGGVSGHAGLFGTVADLGLYATALLQPARHPVLSEATIALMTSRHAGTGGEERTLGWRTGPADWGDWPDGTLWHTGFTGTSLLIAPELDAAVVLLTNAVHPVRRLVETATLRASLHRIVLAALSG